MIWSASSISIQAEGFIPKDVAISELCSESYNSNTECFPLYHDFYMDSDYESQENGVLFGSVEYIWGDAIELVSGATILIQDFTNTIVFSAITDNNGQYEIELPEGAYIVTALSLIHI